MKTANGADVQQQKKLFTRHLLHKIINKTKDMSWKHEVAWKKFSSIGFYNQVAKL